MLLVVFCCIRTRTSKICTLISIEEKRTASVSSSSSNVSGSLLAYLRNRPLNIPIRSKTWNTL